jgi:hypothetical protein
MKEETDGEDRRQRGGGGRRGIRREGMGGKR